MGINEGTLEKRGKVWHWRFRMDGKQCCRSLKTASLAEARRLRQALILEYHTNSGALAQTKTDLDVGEFERLYFEWAETGRNVRARTVEMKRTWWRCFVGFAKARRMGSVTAAQVEGFKTFLVNKGPKGKPLSKTSANIALRSIASMFSLGVQKGWIERNPAKGIKQYSVTETRRSKQDFLTREERDRLVAAAKEHSTNMYWFVLLCAFAGMRKMEAVNARWEWFDFEGRVITIKEYGEFQLKDAAERTIALHPLIREALLPHAKAEGYLFESNRPSEGKWRYRWDPKRSLETVAEAAGVEGVSAQVLRITFGSIAVQAGIDIYQVSEWLGHSDVRVTRQHYAALLSHNPDIEKL